MAVGVSERRLMRVSAMASGSWIGMADVESLALRQASTAGGFALGEVRQGNGGVHFPPRQQGEHGGCATCARGC